MFFKRFISLLLVVLILMAESGQTVFAHTCYKSHTTSYSLYSPQACNTAPVKQSCCDTEQPGETDHCKLSKTACCGLSSVFVKYSFPANNFEIQKTEVQQAMLSLLPLVMVYPISEFSTPSSFAHSPPLFRLHSAVFLQVFRC